MCMEQYYRLFTSYRYPGVERDSLETSLIARDDQPQHIIVACKDQVEIRNITAAQVIIIQTLR